MKVRVLALFRAKPDKIAELEAVLRSFVEPTRRESGCVYYDLQQSVADPADFSFFEEWDSDEQLDAHGRSPHITAGRAKLPELLAAPADVRRYRHIC